MKRQVMYCGCGSCEFIVIDGELKCACDECMLVPMEAL